MQFTLIGCTTFLAWVFNRNPEGHDLAQARSRLIGTCGGDRWVGTGGRRMGPLGRLGLSFEFPIFW